MPELHKLTPTLGVLQDRGHKVALITDGRMSGASGKVPAAIHVSPEALPDGPLARVRDGDVIRLDAPRRHARSGRRRPRRPAARQLAAAAVGTGRELFALMRLHAGACRSKGASAMLDAMEAEQGVRQIAVADVGGTHARFALAEIDGGRVVVARRAGHAEDRRACELPDRVGGIRTARRQIDLPNELAIAFAGPVGGEMLKLTNNPWVIRPALIKERLGVDRYTIVNDFGAVGLCRRDAGRRATSSIFAGPSAASRGGRDQHRRPGHRPRRRRAAQEARPL